MDQKQIDSLKQHNEQLAQFITRLSKFYEGASAEVDRELQVLRGHLAGKQNVTLATVSIKKLNNLMMENAQSLKKQSTDTLHRLESAVKKLQRNANMSEDLKGEAARFLSSLSMQSGSVFSSLSQFERVIILYQQALENGKTDEEEAEKGGNKQAKPNLDKPIDDRLHAKISAELQQLIEPYYQKNQSDTLLSDVRKKLLDGLTQHELLECCLVLIRLIIKDAVREAGVNGKVIESLHKSIITINQDVNQTIEATQAQFESKASHTQELQSQLGDMGDLVNESTDIDTLKSDAQAYLERMQSTISQREEVEKEEEQVLISLLQSLQRELTTMEKKTQQYRKKLLEQRLQTHTDPLTRIPNRIAYNERMVQEFARWQRSNTPLCMAVIDIDHFKSINDRFGHAAGDKTLQVIAKQLRTHLRKTDFLARWGGEEFVVLFPDSELDSLLEPLETLRAKLESLPFKFKQEPVTITASFGVTQFQEGDSIETVFDRADKYLYSAKNNGRNRIESDAGSSQ
ncbi:GGDEF domain-containing protein [Alteromonas oceanisediminis]|uniref:GGDEF domain-containing protein n=1 Tax=Alteromonas oceanisediminis TaxID=2836180 RepID=UPI001BDB0706|nr:GGDEF domain-containing protein [Alteromonas oceanisediminis]MBT0585027.1 GGDEF domain-containing protein [Alteromonas oceanisediminis]